VHRLAGKYEPEFLKTCTLYASTEPCPMCTGAVYWSGIGKIVYALGKDQYHRISGTTNPDYVFDLSARELLKCGGRTVEVAGPELEEEAAAFYRGLAGEG
jgi:tRNA(adenine34) deaminase